MPVATMQDVVDEEHGKIGNAQPRYYHDPSLPYAGVYTATGDTEKTISFESLFGVWMEKSRFDSSTIKTCDGMGWNVLTAFISEFVATLFFVLAANLASAIAISDGTLAGAITYALVVGFVYLLLKTVLGEVTAIMDPTRVIVEFFMPHVWMTIGWANGFLLMIVKLVAILVGAIAGAAIVLAIGVPDAGIPVYGFGVGTGIAFLIEFLGAGLLMWVLLVTNYDRVSKWRNLTQGFVLIGLSALFFPFTTAAFNFSRYFGAAVVTANFDSTAWVYAFAPLVGQLVFALIWFFIFRYPTGGLSRKGYKEM